MRSSSRSRTRPTKLAFSVRRLDSMDSKYTMRSYVVGQASEDAIDRSAAGPSKPYLDQAFLRVPVRRETLVSVHKIGEPIGSIHGRRPLMEGRVVDVLLPCKGSSVVGSNAGWRSPGTVVGQNNM